MKMIVLRVRDREGAPFVLGSSVDSKGLEWNTCLEDWDADETERQRIKDPSLVAAPPMPICLIEPVTKGGGCQRR
jgi:hypothetical protein